MRKLAIAVLMLAASTAQAQHFHNHYYGGYRNNWVGPAIVGGVIGYELRRPHETVIIQQQPVIIQPQPVPPQGYHYITVLDPMCNCYKQALVPN